MQHASSPERYVQAKVSAVAAQLMKRGWLAFLSFCFSQTLDTHFLYTTMGY